MGTWGLGTFDDDVACDWLEDLGDSDPIAFFRACLDLSGESHLGYVACVGVLCTAEMLNALINGPRDGLPAAASQWVSERESLVVDALVPDAIAGLQRVLETESEMRVRWEDNEEHFPKWQSQVTDLLHRLGSSTNLQW